MFIYMCTHCTGTKHTFMLFYALTDLHFIIIQVLKYIIRNYNKTKTGIKVKLCGRGLCGKAAEVM